MLEIGLGKLQKHVNKVVLGRHLAHMSIWQWCTRVANLVGFLEAGGVVKIIDFGVRSDLTPPKPRGLGRELGLGRTK